MVYMRGGEVHPAVVMKVRHACVAMKVVCGMHLMKKLDLGVYGVYTVGWYVAGTLCTLLSKSPPTITRVKFCFLFPRGASDQGSARVNAAHAHHKQR